MIFKIFVLFLISINSYAVTELDLNEVLSKQKKSFQQGDLQSYFGRRVYLNTYFEQKHVLADVRNDFKILDVLAFSKICDFSMANSVLAELKSKKIEANRDLELAIEYLNLRQKIYNGKINKTTRSNKRVDEIKSYWRISKRNLLSIRNLDRLKVKVESLCVNV